MELSNQDSQKKELFREVQQGAAFRYMDRVYIKIAIDDVFRALLLPDGVIVNIDGLEVVEVFSDCRVTVTV